MQITNTTKEEIQAHARESYPNECCGLIVDGKYIRSDNLSETPTEAFKLNQDLYLDALRAGTLQAVIHSHCYDSANPPKYDPRWASTKDMEVWIESNVVWGIVAATESEASEILWYDDNDIPPLLGRQFFHGITDCYSVIRDHYRTVLNIKLKNYPRGMSWWNNGQNLYEANFRDAGFIEITEEEADTNDVCLFQVRSPVPNHAAVITGNNEITHHLFHRLSERDRLDRWRGQIVKYLRYAPELNTVSKGIDDDKNNTTPRLVS